MVFGFTSGAIEFWNPLMHIRRSDLDFQQDNLCISCSSPVIALSFNNNGELLAIGEQNGTFSLHKTSTGQKIISIPNVHNQGITCICWNEDSTQILTTGYDSLAKIIGLKTFTTLKEFRGHKSFVLSGCYFHNYKQVITAGTDGTVKIWNLSSGECLFRFVLGLTIE